MCKRLRVSYKFILYPTCCSSSCVKNHNAVAEFVVVWCISSVIVWRISVCVAVKKESQLGHVLCNGLRDIHNTENEEQLPLFHNSIFPYLMIMYKDIAFYVCKYGKVPKSHIDTTNVYHYNESTDVCLTQTFDICVIQLENDPKYMCCIQHITRRLLRYTI